MAGRTVLVLGGGVGGMVAANELERRITLAALTAGGRLAGLRVMP